MVRHQFAGLLRARYHEKLGQLENGHRALLAVAIDLRRRIIRRRGICLGDASERGNGGGDRGQKRSSLGHLWLPYVDN